MHRQSSKSLGGAAFDLNQQAGAYANARDIRPHFAQLPPFGYGCFVAYDSLTPSGSFVVPHGVFKLRVRLVGAGGGGGGTSGAGGAGGTTSFGGIFSATGGAGGHGGNSGTPAPGIGVGGDLNTSGGNGGGGAPAGGSYSGGGGGGSGTQVGNGGNGGGSTGTQASGGNALIVAEPAYRSHTGNASSDTYWSSILQVKPFLAPRFEFEFFSKQSFFDGGTYQYPWDGRGGTGSGVPTKQPSFGGGGQSGLRATSGSSYTTGFPGGTGGGGGGSGQDEYNLTIAVGRGGDGGGFALKIIDVTPGQSFAFSVGAGGAGGAGTKTGGSGGGGFIAIEY